MKKVIGSLMICLFSSIIFGMMVNCVGFLEALKVCGFAILLASILYGGLFLLGGKKWLQ